MINLISEDSIFVSRLSLFAAKNMADITRRGLEETIALLNEQLTRASNRAEKEAKERREAEVAAALEMQTTALRESSASHARALSKARAEASSMVEEVRESMEAAAVVNSMVATTVEEETKSSLRLAIFDAEERQARTLTKLIRNDVKSMLSQCQPDVKAMSNLSNRCQNDAKSMSNRWLVDG